MESAKLHLWKPSNLCWRLICLNALITVNFHFFACLMFLYIDDSVNFYLGRETVLYKLYYFIITRILTRRCPGNRSFASLSLSLCPGKILSLLSPLSTSDSLSPISLPLWPSLPTFLSHPSFSLPPCLSLSLSLSLSYFVAFSKVMIIFPLIH